MVKVLLRVGHNEALLAGHEGAGCVVVDVPASSLSQMERETLVSVGVAHADRCDYDLNSSVQFHGSTIWVPDCAEANEAAVHAALAHIGAEVARLSAAAAAQAEVDNAAALAAAAKRVPLCRAFLADASARATVDVDGVVHLSGCHGFYPSAGALEAEVQAVAKSRNAADAEALKIVIARVSAEKDLADAAAAKSKSAQLTGAVNRLGDELQRERWAAGVMPVAEAVGLVEGEVLKAFSQSGLTLCDVSEEHLEVEDVEHGEYCEARDLAYSESEKAPLNNVQWADLKKVRSVLPASASIVPMVCVGECDCGGKAKLVFARASWTVGEILIERDILLGS